MLACSLLTLILLTAIFRWDQEDSRDTLTRVQSRRLLICGINGGICAAHGKRIQFMTFLRYGVPVTLAQLVVAAVYVLALHYFL